MHQLEPRLRRWLSQK